MKKIASSENIENFSRNDYIYIDKTEYIYNLIENNERVFFSRPRRFGKSLTLNTIGTLFEKGVDPYFKGTWIYDKWQQHKYPVLHLNFLKFRVKSLREFKDIFSKAIKDFAVQQNLPGTVNSNEPDIAINELFMALKDRQIVILIDEYDCQLTANINNAELYEEFRTCIREFYAVLKGEKHIKFLAVTGVTRLKDVSIFSVGSDIIDLSYDHAYSQMIGFTRSEIKKFYIDYLKLGVAYEQHKEAETVTDDEIEDLLDRMAEHYDGYCFDNKYRNKVYSTYSVNRFLQTLVADKEVEFSDYWYEAGGVPSILNNYLQSHELNLERFQSSAIEVNLNDFLNPTTLPTMDENVLMCQTGYLTLKSDINPNRSSLLMGFANREVSSALSRLLSLKFFKKQIEILTYDNVNVLETYTADELVSLFNSVLAAVAYDRYPISSESVLAALLQFYLMGKGVDVRVEQHNSKGRSDILINLKNRRIVLELKFSADGRNSETLLKDAVNQINDKEYGTENLCNRQLLKIACVFDASESKRKITAYHTVY